MNVKTILALACTLAIASGCSSAKKEVESTAAGTSAPSAEPAKAVAEVKAASASKSNSMGGLKMVECKKKGDDRKLEIVEKNGGCELQYTKMGKTETPATQMSGTAKCDEVLDRIHKKLTAAGYECNG